MRVTNAIPNDYNEFPIINKSEINNPTRKLMQSWQLNPRGYTSNQNRNSDVGNNEGQQWSQNVPT